MVSRLVGWSNGGRADDASTDGQELDAYRMNRFVKGLEPASGGAHAVLETFQRWPTWMWAN